MVLGNILLGIIISMGVSNVDIQSTDNEIIDSGRHIYNSCYRVVNSVSSIEYEPEPVTECIEYEEAEYTTEYEVYEPSYISEDEASLIALITMAEAEAEPVEGQRLVIDTILNRVDSDIFPNTVYDVIYQANQFECVWNGRADRCYVRDDIYQLVLEEMNSRYNYDVTFFRTERYSDYGVPMFQVGNHFFSSYY